MMNCMAIYEGRAVPKQQDQEFSDFDEALKCE